MDLAIGIVISLLGGFALGYVLANMNAKKLLQAQEDVLSQEKEKLDTIKKETELGEYLYLPIMTLFMKLQSL